MHNDPAAPHDQCERPEVPAAVNEQFQTESKVTKRVGKPTNQCWGSGSEGTASFCWIRISVENADRDAQGGSDHDQNSINCQKLNLKMLHNFSTFLADL